MPVYSREYCSDHGFTVGRDDPRDTLLFSTYALAVGGGEEIFRRHSVRIGIIHVKVDGLERSKQHWNMHSLSTCDRHRRVTDAVPQTRAQISKVRRAHADPFRATRHARKCTLPPQVHSWMPPPPVGTTACEMGLRQQPKGGSGHNRARPQPLTCTHGKSLQTCPCHPTKLPSAPPAPPPDTRPARAPTVARFRAPWLGTMASRSVKPPSRWSSQIDASVTTASGVDLWTRESVSARSRAYARLRWGVRGSIARSPNGFAPRPGAPSRSHGQLTGTRT